MDLYARLGVAQRANSAQIKAAYRKKAKVLHPDLGGSAEAFEALNQAYRILSDAARRRRYDDTGIFEDVDASSEEAEALTLINQVLSQILVHDQDFLTVDIVDVIAKTLAKEIQNHRGILAKLITASSRLSRMKGRFHSGSRDRFEPMLAWHAAHLAKQILVQEGHIAQRERAIAILMDCRFVPEARRRPSPGYMSGETVTFSY
jgi:curved DNA-binding protein CbpA